MIFVSMFHHVFDGSWSQSIPKLITRDILLAPFSRPVLDIDFGMHFGRPVARFWFPVASFWLTFGALWLTLCTPRVAVKVWFEPFLSGFVALKKMQGSYTLSYDRFPPCMRILFLRPGAGILPQATEIAAWPPFSDPQTQNVGFLVDFLPHENSSNSSKTSKVGPLITQTSISSSLLGSIFA